MSKPIRFTSAASLVALATVIAGCAAPQNGIATSSGKAKDEIGLATRALAALNASDFANAVSLAERAVENTPDNAGVRVLLGNAYFGAGRFASAEAAYKDVLALNPGQPAVVLKLALVEIGQGKHAQAIDLLESNRAQLDPADFGLALALAGRAADAVPVLERAARVPNADSRVRQNLALAYAFAGDWERARMVASQDVPAGQLDARLQQWMQLAKPDKTSDQVAALTGVTPAVSDPGQPTRLALVRQPETQMAEAAPAPQPAYAEHAPAVAIAEPVPAPPIAEPIPAPQFAEAAPLPPLPAPEPAPIADEAPVPVPPPSIIARMAAAAAEAPAAIAALVPKAEAPKAKLSRASVTAKLPPARNAVLRSGKSKAVVQLGAYRSPQHVTTAWNTLTQRYPALRSHLPLRARFDSPKGTYYRLSIQGFDSQQEAISHCKLLKSRGGNCFVRNAAGDAPIQIASR